MTIPLSFWATFFYDLIQPYPMYSEQVELNQDYKFLTQGHDTKWKLGVKILCPVGTE